MGQRSSHRRQLKSRLAAEHTQAVRGPSLVTPARRIFVGQVHPVAKPPFSRIESRVDHNKRPLLFDQRRSRIVRRRRSVIPANVERHRVDQAKAGDRQRLAADRDCVALVESRASKFLRAAARAVVASAVPIERNAVDLINPLQLLAGPPGIVEPLAVVLKTRVAPVTATGCDVFGFLGRAPANLQRPRIKRTVNTARRLAPRTTMTSYLREMSSLTMQDCMPVIASTSSVVCVTASGSVLPPGSVTSLTAVVDTFSSACVNVLSHSSHQVRPRLRSRSVLRICRTDRPSVNVGGASWASKNVRMPESMAFVT